MVVQKCKEIIDTCCNVVTQPHLTKSVVIRGHTGSGKSLCLLYIVLYRILKGLYSTGTARMCHHLLQMVTQHWHLI